MPLLQVGLWSLTHYSFRDGAVQLDSLVSQVDKNDWKSTDYWIFFQFIWLWFILSDWFISTSRKLINRSVGAGMFFFFQGNASGGWMSLSDVAICRFQNEIQHVPAWVDWRKGTGRDGFSREMNFIYFSFIFTESWLLWQRQMTLIKTPDQNTWFVINCPTTVFIDLFISVW